MQRTNMRSFRPGKCREIPTELEKVMNKSFFIGKIECYNIQLPVRYMPSIDEADKMADEIRKLAIRITIGDEISELEKMALYILSNSN